MQLVITAIAVLAGLVFSLAIALLVEELIFGKVFRLFFARPAAVRMKSEQGR
jgi:ABC-type sugar transport system permease subunit